MSIYIIRLAWSAAIICALASGADLGMRRYRGWIAYLGASICVGVFSWTEIIIGPDAILDAMWPAMLVVLVLRGVSMLEALHHQTCRLPEWSRMMLGVFLVVSGLVLAMAVWRHAMPTSVPNGNSLRDQFMRFRRYGQLWVGLVAVLTTALYLTVRRGHHGAADQHALIVGLMSLNYAAVGLIDMSIDRSPDFVSWEQGVSYSVDTFLLFWWAIQIAPLLCGLGQLCPYTGPHTRGQAAQDADASDVPQLPLLHARSSLGIDTASWRDNSRQ